MSARGLTDMLPVLDAAIGEFERWRESPAAAALPAHRSANISDKLRVLQGCETIHNLRTGLEHVTYAMGLNRITISEAAPSLQRLIELIAERQSRR
jgi:hypothetical protein